MFTGQVRHRRARRTDFDAIAAILAESGLPTMTPERATLRRFRHLVADLGADLYVAFADVGVLGILHVTYTRQLTAGPQARLELLAVAPEARGRGIGRGLAAFAASRARRRGCTALRCGTDAASEAARTFLTHAGWRPAGEEFMFDLSDPAP